VELDRRLVDQRVLLEEVDADAGAVRLQVVEHGLSFVVWVVDRGGDTQPERRSDAVAREREARWRVGADASV
jgi:hypothetical protein